MATTLKRTASIHPTTEPKKAKKESSFMATVVVTNEDAEQVSFKVVGPFDTELACRTPITEHLRDFIEREILDEEDGGLDKEQKQQFAKAKEASELGYIEDYQERLDGIFEDLGNYSVYINVFNVQVI